jgi:hypothetical protein
MDHAMDVYDEACLQVTAAAERKHLIDKLLKEKRAALKAIKEGRKLRNGGSGGRPKKRAKAKSDALKHEIAKLERGFLIDENEPPAPPRPEQLSLRLRLLRLRLGLRLHRSCCCRRSFTAYRPRRMMW